MSLLSLTSQDRSPLPVSWRRRKRARWTRGDKLASPAAMFSAIPSLPRAKLARLTNRLLDRVDDIDGDGDAGPKQELAYE
jgi:hypothetical protein